MPQTPGFVGKYPQFAHKKLRSARGYFIEMIAALHKPF
jgi:hypothetical protein